MPTGVVDKLLMTYARAKRELSVCAGNTKVRFSRTDLAIARLVQKGLSLIFPVQTSLSGNM